MSHVKNIVQKPWGYEYLMYENDKVAIWLLYLNYNHQTSMHCHPSKTTGLALVDGQAEVSFLRGKKKLNPLDKVMIRKGLFHSTRCTSPDGAIVLEIETPVDKSDLVRFQDSYGRQGKPYEDSNHEYPKLDECIWIEDPSHGETHKYVVSDTTLKVMHIQDIGFLSGLEKDQNVMFINGGILTDYGVNVAGPGDIISGATLKDLISVFKKLSDDTVVMMMERDV